MYTRQLYSATGRPALQIHSMFELFTPKQLKPCNANPVVFNVYQSWYGLGRISQSQPEYHKVSHDVGVVCWFSCSDNSS